MIQTAHRILNNLLRIIKVTLTTGWISILIIGIIVFLLTQMEQGSALLVSLLNSPGNMFLFMILIIALLLVIGHYPIYLMMWRRDHSVYRTYEAHKQPVAWNMKEIWGGLGWISFREENEKRSNTFLFRQVNYVRGVLGLTFILCLSIILNHAIKAYIYEDFPNFWVSGIIFGLLLIIHTSLHNNRFRILALPGPYAIMHRSIFFLFWGATVTAVGAIISSIAFEQGWNSFTFIFFILHWAFIGLLYCLFKNFRSELKFIPYLWPISNLGHHLTFIKFSAFLGLLAFSIFFLSQFTTLFHPLVILLSFLHLIYGVFIVILKHRFYYISNPYLRRHKFARFFFLYLTPVLAPLAIGLIFIAGKLGNDLHLLPGTEKKESISLEEFKQRFYSHIDTTSITDSTLYFIASYGGGLKANAWNLMVLDSLSQFQGQNILNQTVAMSGVSGGALGQHFHASLESQDWSRNQKQAIIDEIARSNMLSLDIAWLLGYDLVREAIPFASFSHPDRAGKAMETYAKILRDSAILTTAYQEYWADLFQKQYYPIQMTNAAGTHQRRGIACSVELDDFPNVFPNADNLCDLGENQSLSYAEAVSSSHRFPVFSPAAKIEGKGHYVDGGYFENSGMLTLLDLFMYLQKDPQWVSYFKNWTIAFVQIRNDKQAFLRSRLNINEIEISETGESKELFSILTALNSTRHLPMYIEDRLQSLPMENFTFSAIDLPYRLSSEEVEEVLKAKEFHPQSQFLVDSIIAEANAEIKGALSNHPYPEWGTIEPPLARFLSQPAVNYMQIMLKHDTLLFSDFQSSRHRQKPIAQDQ